MSTVRVETKASDFALTHTRGVLVCDFKSNKIRTSAARFINSRLRQIFKDNPGFVHSRVEAGKITVLTTSTRALQDILTTGKRIIEETRDVTRVYISGTQCVSRSSLLGILGEHVGHVATDSLRLSSWMQHQTQYGDIAFADVIINDGVSLPITFEVVEDGEAVGSFTVDLAKAKAAEASAPPPQLRSAGPRCSAPQGPASASAVNDGWHFRGKHSQGAGRGDNWAAARQPSIPHGRGHSSFADIVRRQERYPGSFRAEDFDVDQDLQAPGTQEHDHPSLASEETMDVRAPGPHTVATASPPPAVPVLPTSGASTLGQVADAPPALQVPLAAPVASTPHPLSSTADGGLEVLEPAPHTGPDSTPGSIAHSLRSMALSLSEDDTSLALTPGPSATSLSSSSTSSSSSSSSSRTINHNNNGRGGNSTSGKGTTGGKAPPRPATATGLQSSRRLPSQGAQQLSAAQRSAAPASQSNTKATASPPGARTRSRSKEPGRTSDTRAADAQGRRPTQ